MVASGSGGRRQLAGLLLLRHHSFPTGTWAKAQGVYGLKANFNHRFGDAEDYASLMVRYPEAVSILEGTWNTISSGYPSGPIVWGEKGA